MRGVWRVTSVVLLTVLVGCGDDGKLVKGPLDSGQSDSPDGTSGGPDARDAGDSSAPHDARDSSTSDAGADADAATIEALYIYEDSLRTPWIDASWDAEVEFSSAEQVSAGSYAIGAVQQDGGALSFLNGDWGAVQNIDPQDYDEFSFEIYAPEAVTIDVALQGDDTFDRIDVGSISAGAWTTVTIPMDDLAPDANLFHRINIKETSGATATYWVDNIRLIDRQSGQPDAGPGGDAGDGADADAGPQPDGGGLPTSEFVTVDPNAPRFLLNGEPFYFVGTNLYWMVQRRTYGHSMVDDALDMCQDMGLRVIRIWGFADGDAWTNPSDSAIMQPDAGVFNEAAFEALDYVLAEAAKHDVKVIIPFINYWEDYGGMLQYARWAGGNSYEYFYTQMATKQLYKDYVQKLVTRTNTITGVEYRNDPTIMAWELANEARAPFDDDAANATLEMWYAQMAAYVRSLDANHMIATGEEGWEISSHADQYADNYSNTYALRGAQGSSYANNTALSDISYGGAHMYPDVWGFSAPVTDGQSWIKDHAAIARQTGKPFVLGEFGYSDRSVYQDWLQAAEQEDVAGTLMWQIVPASRGRENDMTIVYPDDTDLVDLFSQHAQYMNAKGQTTP